MFLQSMLKVNIKRARIYLCRKADVKQRVEAFYINIYGLVLNYFVNSNIMSLLLFTNFAIASVESGWLLRSAKS